jgi:hypothetical protein
MDGAELGYEWRQEDPEDLPRSHAWTISNNRADGWVRMQAGKYIAFFGGPLCRIVP